MSNEEEMTIDERWKYLRKMKQRYVKVGRKEQGRLLDEMEAVTGMHRKSLIRRMNSDLVRQARSREREETYGPEVDDALRVIYESFDCICADRLTPNLVWMASHLARHGELATTSTLLDQLAQISISTVERRLDRIRQDQPRLPRRGPKAGRKLIRDVPMLRLPWDLQEVGFLETDLVHHCGATASGEYACTVQMIDVLTGWSERRAVLGRSYLVMEDAFRYFLCRLPFPVQQIHPDNDSVFFNHHMLRFWREIVVGVTLSRSRPYNKNDNPRVEQKNSTLVRKYFGNERIDSVVQVIVINELYDEMWLYYNLFQPVMHLVEKEVILEDGKPARVKRCYDQARTPFDRLCETDAILPAHREQLEALRDSINPRQLRQDIYDAIERIFSLPGAVPGVSQDVFETLVFHPLSKMAKHNQRQVLNFSFNRTRIKEEEKEQTE